VSGTRSLRLLLLSFVFCAGLALAASTAGISALATGTQQKLNPPTALWNAYPLRQAHSTANKPISTGKSKVTKTGPTETRPTAVRGNRVAGRPNSGAGGFPTVFVMTGVLGALLASALLFAGHAAPARAGVYRRSRGPIKTKPPSRTGRAGRHSPARTKPSRAKPPPTVEQPSRTKPISPPPPKPVDETPPEEREETDDLLDALRPNIKPAEDPEQVSEPVSGLRAVRPVEADQHHLAVVRQAPPQRREAARDQFCEIKFWRGYVKCQLYVEVEGSPGVFVKSPFFRLRDPMVPDDRAQSALADLLADLERSGWSVVATGRVWYQRRLQRSTPAH
jgi:hypothetical protein